LLVEAFTQSEFRKHPMVNADGFASAVESNRQPILRLIKKMVWNNGRCQELSARPSGAWKMLHLVVTLLIIALMAGVLGFGGIAGAAVGIAKIVFVVALVLFLVSLLAGGMRGGFSRRL
jgi:uncharacterized membrane protein YtjA (UPF0391 family)